MKQAEILIQKYNLQKHPEGGWFSEVYTAPYEVNNREYCGSIYFLLNKDEISHFHVIDCDEIWYYHAGSGMRITMIENNEITHKDLGMQENQEAMIVIPKGVLFAAENLDKDSYTFVSCVTTPQFQYVGFHLVSQEEVQCDTNSIKHLFMTKEEIDTVEY